MQEERLVFAGLRTRNYDRMVWFYRDIIGVPLEEDDHPPEGVHSEYSWHNSYLHFAIFKCAPDREPTRAELSFSTNDVEAVHARAVAAGGASPAGAQPTFMGVQRRLPGPGRQSGWRHRDEEAYDLIGRVTRAACLAVCQS